MRTFDPEAERAKPPRYRASQQIERFEVSLELYHHHPFLAEYLIVLSVSRSGQILAKEEFIDSGGLSAFYCLEDGGRFLISNRKNDGVVIDKARAKAARIHGEIIPQDFESRAFGVFDFMRDGERTYEYKILKSTSIN